jgi:hypothetical protein
MTCNALKPVSKSRRAFSRSLLALPATVSSKLHAAPPTSGQRETKVLRYAFRVAETGFDPAAFNGRRRELIARDYVYSIRRFYDPRCKSPRMIRGGSAA